MDTTTAQAISDLVNLGRLSDESTEAVNKALGLHYDEDTGRWANKAESKPEDTTAKGPGR